MSATLLVIHLIITLAMIVLVLLQRSETQFVGVAWAASTTISVAW